MSEFNGQLPAGTAMMQRESLQDAPAISAGTLLRQARESAGLHIAALAVALKVPVKKLEALESDQLDLLPDAVFVRALASSVCRTLKMDVAPVLALLPQSGKPRVGEQHASINTPFRVPGEGPGPSLWAHLSRPVVLAGLLLVGGALVMIFLPAVQLQNSADPVLTETAAAEALVAPAPEPVAVAATELPGAASPAALGRPVEPAVAAATSPAAAPLLAANLSAPPALPEPAATVAAAPVPAAAAGTIVFMAKGQSWVEVTDAKGVVVLRRTLAAGESAGASGAMPLAAVVGRVDATQVQVRGQAFDLNAVAKDNVARFEVK